MIYCLTGKIIKKTLDSAVISCGGVGYFVQIPATTGEVMQCVYNSLTQDYRRAVETLQSLTGKTYTSLNIVGGGSQDGYLNQQTANATGLTVFAGPTEGTALGNLMVQFIHSGDFADLAEARAAIRRSFEIKEYQPE